MSLIKVYATILVIAVITFFTRILPFLFFKNTKQIPRFIKFLEENIPGMIMLILVAYCLKDINLNNIISSLILIVSSVVVAVLHLVIKNALISIVGGTILYMVLLSIF